MATGFQDNLATVLYSPLLYCDKAGSGEGAAKGGEVPKMGKEWFMKKFKFAAVFIAAFALAACALAGCSSNANSSEASPSAASEGFTLVVGFDAEYPPYGFVGDDGEYTGFDLDLAQAVCEANGWEFQAEPIDWDAKDALLDSGTINCIWNGFTMEGREDSYSFSEAYMLNEQVIVVKADAGITDFAGLKDKAVMTQADSAALAVLEDEEGQKALADTFSKLETIGDYNNAFMQLDSGMVDAVACDLSIAQYQLSANPDKYIMIAEPLSSEHYAVGFAKGDTATADAVTASLKALYEDGTVEELIEKYADYGMDINNWVLK